jgi:inorganic pyrophosphatase
MKVPTFRADGAFHVVIESPRGSTVKLKYDPATEAVTWRRPLVLGLSYPFDWGFVPGTSGPDGDPVDAMVLWEGSSYPGVIIPCRAVGVLAAEQDNKENPATRERNDRILAVPENAARSAPVASIFDLPERVRDELAAFFLQVTAFERKNLALLGWHGPEAAAPLLGRAPLLTSPGAASR